MWAINLDDLEDERYYFVKLNKYESLPFATGKELKKNWKKSILQKFSPNEPTQRYYQLVRCPDDNCISVKPFGLKALSLVTEMDKLTKASKQILVG